MGNHNSIQIKDFMWATSNRGLLIIFITLLSVSIGLAIVSLDRFIAYTPSVILAVIIFLPLTLILFRHPYWAIILFWVVIFTLGTDMEPGLKVGDFTFLITDYFLLVGLVPLLLKRNGQYSKSSIGFKFIFAICIFIFFTLWGIFQDNSTRVMLTDLRLVFYAMTYWYMFQRLIDLYSLEFIARITLYSLSLGAIACGSRSILLSLGIGSALLNSALIYDPQTYDAQIGVTRLIILGSDTLAVVSFPILFSLLIGKTQKPGRFWIIGGLIGSIVITIMSYTRADWIAVAVGTIIVIIAYTRHNLPRLRYRALIVCLLGIIMLYGFSFMVLPGSLYPLREVVFRRFSTHISGNLEYRMRESRALLEKVASSPLFGTGLGGQFLFKEFSAPVEIMVGWAHTGWEWLLLKGGVIGLVVIVYILCSLFIPLWRYKKSSVAIPELIPFVTGILGGLVAFVVMCTTNNRFASVEGVVFLVFCLVSGQTARSNTLLTKENPKAE